MTDTLIEMKSINPISLEEETFEYCVEFEDPQKRTTEKRSRSMISSIQKLLRDEVEEQIREERLTIIQRLLHSDELEPEERELRLELIPETEVKVTILNEDEEVKEVKEEISVPIPTPTPIQEGKPVAKSKRTKKQKTQISRDV